MHGMTRAEIDTVESGDIRRGAGPKRPRDAATLILLDSEGGAVRVLMGRRHMRHAFMPGKFVFPGGRTDPADGRVAVSEGLAAEDLAALDRKKAAELYRELAAIVPVSGVSPNNRQVFRFATLAGSWWESRDAKTSAGQAATLRLRTGIRASTSSTGSPTSAYFVWSRNSA